MRLLWILLAVIASASAKKFLAYSPMFARSHSTFIGKISDALVDAGHEVVMLVPLIDTSEGTVGTKKARVIKVEQCESSRKFEALNSHAEGFSGTMWRTQSFLWMMMTTIIQASKDTDPWVEQCNVTLGMVEQLKAEKFDAAYGELINDPCGLILFHLLGIKKYAITLSFVTMEFGFEFTGAPTVPSYIPGITAYYGEQMTFGERFANAFSLVFSKMVVKLGAKRYQGLIDSRFPNGFPNIIDLMAEASLVFLNSEPLIDFPKTTVAKIVDIGGITVSDGHKPLDEKWDAIMSLRDQTVFISFGTFAKTHLMPEEYKATIVETARRLSNVTFIWKYEKPEHEIGKGVENLLPVTWVPQNDMLYDPRLSLFITHAGAGSMLEATISGVPLIVIPIQGDQRRNAQTVQRVGSGIILNKNQLATPGDLEAAIGEALSNPSYREAAVRTAAMIAARPFSVRQTFVRHMEFLAEFGPLRNLDHYGRHLSFIEYYLLDVLALVGVVILFVLSIFILSCMWMFRCIRHKFTSSKPKQD